MPVTRRTTGLAGGLLALTLLAAAGCGTVPETEQAAPKDAPASSPAQSPAVQGPAAPETSPSPTAAKTTKAEQTGVTKTTDQQEKAAEQAKDKAAEEKQAAEKKAANQKAEKQQAEKKKAPATKAILSRGSKGDKVRELQHRLLQLDWYQGKVTGNYGDTTAQSVSGFQGKRDLNDTGSVDQKTWSALVDMTQRPSHNEMYNVLTPGKALWKNGSEGDKVREVQARLKQVGWYSEKVTGNYGSVTTASVKGFQKKREIPATGEVDQRTWDRLTGMTRNPTKDELHNKVAKTKTDSSTAGLDSRCLTGRAMCISKSSNQLVWVVDGKPQLRFDVRFGSDQDPTREGAFSLGWKARDWTSTIYHSKMPYSMFFSGGQAVHYSSDFAARGYNGASHGCVNVRNLEGIQSLFEQAKVGDKVIVYS